MQKKKGSALVIVILVVSVLMILGASLLSATGSTYTMENAVDISNRLNSMAESGMEIALSQVKSINGTSSAADFTDISGLKSDDGTITCNVKFYKDQQYDAKTRSYVTASGKYTIESTASSSKESKTIRAVISNSSTSVPTGIVPTDNLFYVNGSIPSQSDDKKKSYNFAVDKINGDICTNGDFVLSNGGTITGRLISTGNITISGGASSNNGVISFKNIELDSGGSVNGDALAKGYINFGGGTIVTGNAKCDGNLGMPQGTIQKDAVTGGNASFSGGNNKIDGKLYYQGSISTPIKKNNTQPLTDFVPNGAVKTTSYTPLDLSSYTPPNSLPVISPPDSTENPQLYSAVKLNYNSSSDTYCINNSGSLTSTTFSSIGWGKTVTIDTSNNDISLLIDNFNFSTGNGLDIEVTGPHNLYIYMTGSSGFTVDNQYFRMQNHSAASTNIYIFGDGNQSINLNNCELDANVYIPNGTLSASGGAKNFYMFQGSCITKALDISSAISANYLKPNIAGTPLEDVLNNLKYTPSGGSGGSLTTTNNWQVDNWYN